MCNTLGQCHCNEGYAPPDCSKPGAGGSYHSNPAKEVKPEVTTKDTGVTQAATEKPDPSEKQVPTNTSGAHHTLWSIFR